MDSTSSELSTAATMHEERRKRLGATQAEAKMGAMWRMATSHDTTEHGANPEPKRRLNGWC
jgi:hypothetical protein